MFKQDLAMAYFPDRSNVASSESRESLLTMPSISNVTEGKESAGKLLAREIHTNEPLMSELSKTAYSPPTQNPLPQTTPNHLLLPRRTLTLEEVMNTLKNTDIMVNKEAYIYENEPTK